jgi:hypothetical protein
VCERYGGDVLTEVWWQVRFVLYMGAITAGILGGMAMFEKDVIAALHGEGVRQHFGARLSTHLHGSLEETLTNHVELRPVTVSKTPGCQLNVVEN